MASKAVEDAIIAYIAANNPTGLSRKDLDNLTDDDLAEVALTQFYAVDFPAVGSEQRASFGNPGSNRFSEVGAVQIHVFVRSNTGRAVAAGYAEQFANLMRTKSFSGVRTDAVDPPQGGPGNDSGSWYRVTVSVDFEFSTFH